MSCDRIEGYEQINEIYLDRHTSHDGTLMSLQCDKGNMLNLSFGFVKKLFTSS